jgi:hypothetical protein
MNKFAAFLLPLLLMPLSAGAADSVTFTHQPVKGNQTLTEEQIETLSLAFDITINDAAIGSMSASKNKTEAMSLVLGKWTSKKKSAVMQFGDNSIQEAQTSPNGETQETSVVLPLAGQTYHFEWTHKMEQPVITLNDGGPVEAVDLELLLEKWRDLPSDKPEELEAALEGKTFEVGQVVDLDPTELAGLMDMAGNEFTLSTPEIRLKELRSVNNIPCGVFSMDVKLSGQSDGMDMTMPLIGEFVIGIDTLHMYTAQFEGPIQVEKSGIESGQTLHMLGKGKISFKIARTYEK